jgi:two-component system response regulator QseB
MLCFWLSAHRGLDGIEVLNAYRRAGGLAPVIILSTSDAVADRIRGLDAGADGCVTEPFDSGELAARIRALQRSHAGDAQRVYIRGALTLDPTGYKASKSGKPLLLTRRQFALLLVLIEEPGRVFTRAELEKKLYGRGDNVRSNAIEVHVHSLRRKIGGGEILTIRGIGYRLKML